MVREVEGKTEDLGRTHPREEKGQMEGHPRTERWSSPERDRKDNKSVKPGSSVQCVLNKGRKPGKVSAT